MKERKRAVAAALALLALATTAGIYFATRSGPAAPTASAPPPEPAQPAPPEPPAPTTAPLDSATNAATPAPVAAEGTDRAGTGRAALASPATSDARKRLTQDRSTETAVKTGNRKGDGASKATANGEPTPAEAVAEAQAAPPAPQAPPPPPDGSAVGRFQDQVGSSFTLSRVTCVLDGQTVYSGAGGKRLQLFQRALPPGSHSVAVIAEYRGNSSGVFSYASGYGYKVSSGRRFNVASAKPVHVNVVGYEKGGPTVDFSERLALAISTR